MTLTRLLAMAWVVLLVLPAQAGGSKDPEIRIAFHLETTPGDNPKMIFQQFVAGKQRTFRRMPEVGTRDIQTFNPFPSQDGEGYGVVIRVKPGASHRLTAVTANASNKWLIARVNGRIVDGVIVDGQISDAELVIWKGLSLQEVNQLDKSFPRFGQKKPRG